MDSLQTLLETQFGCFPEPVLLLSAGQVLYANEAGELLLQRDDVPLEMLAALTEHPGTLMDISLEESVYQVTVTPFDYGDLVVLRPGRPPEEGSHPFSNAVGRMREVLSNFSAVNLQLQRRLEEKGLAEELMRPLADQSRLYYQMLRLTRHAELTQELDDRSFPREEGFDLALVCAGMAEYTKLLAEMAGVRFTYSANVDYLPFQASKSLLTQMLLSLISNSVRAAGREGSVEMKLRAEAGRVVISLRDSGAGFPAERMAELFSGHALDEIPRPGEGAGLGLYNARRIALLHGGVIVAQSGQEGGASIVVSLPIVTPDSVPARNNPGFDAPNGFNPVLIELSDMLPWEAFVPGETDR